MYWTVGDFRNLLDAVSDGDAKVPVSFLLTFVACNDLGHNGPGFNTLGRLKRTECAFKFSMQIVLVTLRIGGPSRSRPRAHARRASCRPAQPPTSWPALARREGAQ